jgi:hypothetical protein
VAVAGRGVGRIDNCRRGDWDRQDFIRLSLFLAERIRTGIAVPVTSIRWGAIAKMKKLAAVVEHILSAGAGYSWG